MKVQEALTLEEIRRQFPDEWVLIEVLEEDELGQPTCGRVLAHSLDRDEIYREQARLQGDLAIVHTGEWPRKGFAFTFSLNFLRHFKLTLDFPNGLLTLEPIPPLPSRR